MPYADNKEWMSSLVSVYFVCCLDNIITMLVSEAEQARLRLARSQTPEDRFSCDMAQISGQCHAKMCLVSYAICEQQRRRSACTSVQADNTFVVRCLDSMICILAIFKITFCS